MHIVGLCIYLIVSNTRTNITVFQFASIQIYITENFEVFEMNELKNITHVQLYVKVASLQ